MDEYPRECRFCHCALYYTARDGWVGDHEPHCAVRRSKSRLTRSKAGVMRTPDTFDREAVIGPVGQPLWSVTVSLHRLGTAEVGQAYTETVHARAAGYDGAVLLSRELFPERILDVDAYQITDTQEDQ